MHIELKILNKEFYRDYDNEISAKHEYNVPMYATPGSAAVDLMCAEDVALYPGETKMIPTGLAIHIDSHDDKLMRSWRHHWNYVGLVLPRSGLGTKGLVLANTVGVIDADYHGELMVSAWNRGTEGKIELKAGDRFAQLMFVPVVQAQFSIVDDFSTNTDRGGGSFGSTGE